MNAYLVELIVEVENDDRKDVGGAAYLVIADSISNAEKKAIEKSGEVVLEVSTVQINASEDGKFSTKLIL